MGFEYRNGCLHAEDVALDEIARRHGTPCYVYSRLAIESATANIVTRSPAARH